MKQYIFQCLSRMLPALLAWCAVSCSSGKDMPDVPTPEDEGIHVSIVLAGQSDGTTRSEDGELEEEFGSIAENYINYQYLWVLTFSIPEGETTLSDDSKLLEVLWQPSIINNTTDNSVVTSNGENVYLTTQLDSSIPEYSQGDFCLVAVANLKNFGKTIPSNRLIKGTTFKNFKADLSYSYTSSANDWNWQPNNKTGVGIPMFGVKKVNLNGYDSKIYSAWNPFVLQSKSGPTLWLLRAFAKVTVELADNLGLPDGENVDIKFVSGGGIGNKYADKFYLIPDLDRMKGFKGEDGTEDSGETGPIFKVPSPTELAITSPGPATTKNLMFNASEDGKKAYMYLPEYQFNEGDLPEFTILISIGGGVQEFKFEFKEYPDGEPTRADSPVWKCVLRNHSYHYRIGFDFRVISVIPSSWGDVFDNEFNFG